MKPFFPERTGYSMSDDSVGISTLLDGVRRGDPDAMGRLIPRVYKELRRLAAHYMRRERPDHSLGATALVHEAYLKLVGRAENNWHDREHFFAVAAEAMRRILVDHARARLAAKRRRRSSQMSLDDPPTLVSPKSEALLALDEALTRLAAIDPRQARIVELRYFAGMTIPEVASLLDVTERTVQRDWSLAKAWLYTQIRGQGVG